MKKSAFALSFTKLLLPFFIFFLFIPTTSFAGTEYNATSFNLIGQDGRVTAQLTSSAEGTPAIFFYDQNHVMRLNLGIYPDGGGGLLLIDKDGKEKKITVPNTNDIAEEKTSTTSTEIKKAEIITTPLRTAAEKEREYLLYGMAFLFGLVGAYGGGRIATRRQKALEELLQQTVKEKLSKEAAQAITK